MIIIGKSQRDKGANAEREVANIIKQYGFVARRGLVFIHENDIVSDLPIHVEVKRQETTKIHEWFKQAESACGDLPPTVVHRRSREPWFITMKFEDFLQLLKGGKTNGS